jgi:hypothetical protein
MKSLKVPLIFLFVYITIVFNVEILAFGSTYVLVLHPFVDLLILSIVISSLLFRVFHKLSVYQYTLFWLLVYFGVWVSAERGNYTQTTILITTIEVVMVVIAVFLSREVAKRLYEVENTLDKLVFASFRGRTLSMDEAAEEVKTELLRSRRYQRSLTVMVLEPDPATIHKSTVATVEEIQNNLSLRYAMGKISEVISMTARRPDLVIKQEQFDRFILLCPETSSSSSEILQQRVRESVKSSLGVSLSIGVASFPEDALTFEELLHKASSKLVAPPPSVPSVVRVEESETKNP